MSYYIRKINLFVLIYIFFGFSLIVVASETDSFLAIKDNPKDSSGRINEITNNLLIDALVETNKISNCSQKQLYKSLIKRLKGNVIAGPIEKYINDVDDPLVGWHPSPSGHEAWATELVRYIKENNLL